jgi:hypothetical protein
MMLGVAIALLVLWIILRVFFRVARMSIHLILLIAVIAIAVHFFRAAKL